MIKALRPTMANWAKLRELFAFEVGCADKAGIRCRCGILSFASASCPTLRMDEFKLQNATATTSSKQRALRDGRTSCQCPRFSPSRLRPTRLLKRHAGQTALYSAAEANGAPSNSIP